MIDKFVNRDEEIARVFDGTLGAFGKVLSRLALSNEETEAFQETVFLWFSRFTRRPGNDRIPVERFQIPLLSAACKLAMDFGTRKGFEGVFLAVDPVDLARELGLFDSSDNGTGT